MTENTITIPITPEAIANLPERVLERWYDSAGEAGDLLYAAILRVALGWSTSEIDLDDRERAHVDGLDRDTALAEIARTARDDCVDLRAEIDAPYYRL